MSADVLFVRVRLKTMHEHADSDPWSLEFEQACQPLKAACHKPAFQNDFHSELSWEAVDATTGRAGVESVNAMEIDAEFQL